MRNGTGETSPDANNDLLFLIELFTANDISNIFPSRSYMISKHYPNFIADFCDIWAQLESHSPFFTYVSVLFERGFREEVETLARGGKQ